MDRTKTTELEDRVSLEPGPMGEPSGVMLRRSGRGRWLALAAGILLSIALPVLAFRGIDLAQSWRLALNCQVPALALAGVCFLVTVWLRAWRWRFLLEPLGTVRLRSCLSATCV